MKIILASKSPRRKELIKYLRMPFEVITAEADETVESLSPAEAVLDISKRKARAVKTARGVFEDEVIVGADTVVSLNGVIVGKPADREDAKKTLTFLSGKSHEVFTGVTFIYEKNGTITEKSFFEKTSVTFLPLTEEEIERYLDVNEYADKAGSYAIQGVFSAHVKGIEGDYNNVVGLPVSRIYRELKEITD